MEKFDTDIKQAAVECIERHIPFCLFAMPGADIAPRFFANPGGGDIDATEQIDIIDWLQPAKSAVAVKAEMDARQLLQSLPPYRPDTSPAPWHTSTPKKQYLERLSQLIMSFENNDISKVVVSKTKVLENQSLTPAAIVDVAGNIFAAYPHAFRFLYHTPSTGLWLGASPELLADYDTLTGTLHTMALAGTRTDSHSPQEPWHTKDIEEQKIVTMFIAGELIKAGFDVECAAPATLSTGRLQHIATRITATYSTRPVPTASEVIDLLNPTPALCGMPRQAAAEAIGRIEDHPRRCYGGVLAHREGTHLRAFVNLRCAHLAPHRVCLYAGGGIISRSVAEEEWEETENKVNGILKFFNSESVRQR